MRISDWSSDVCSSDLAYTREDHLNGHRTIGGDFHGPDHLHFHDANVHVWIDDSIQSRHDGHFAYHSERPHSSRCKRSRSEERRGGKESVSTCRSRWARCHSKKKKKTDTRQETH